MFFIIIIHGIITIILKPIDWFNTILWNNGLCRVCKSGRYISDFRPDKFINNQFYCNNCGKRFNSTIRRDSISESEYVIIKRDNKIKEIIDE